MRRTIILAAVTSAIIIDRLLKNLAVNLATAPETDRGFFIIPEILKFSFFQNYHLAFNLPLDKHLIFALSGATIVVLGFYFRLYFKKKKEVAAFSLLLIITGAISNFYDRLTFGFVIDYFYLWRFSFFNLADVLIGGGLLLFLCYPKFIRRPS